jgi:hypothetical protein
MVWDANRSRRPALSYITYSADVYSVLASTFVQDNRHTQAACGACLLEPCRRSTDGRHTDTVPFHARKVGSPNKSAFSFRLSAAATARKGNNPRMCAVRGREVPGVPGVVSGRRLPLAGCLAARVDAWWENPTTNSRWAATALALLGPARRPSGTPGPGVWIHVAKVWAEHLLCTGREVHLTSPFFNEVW